MENIKELLVKYEQAVSEKAVIGSQIENLLNRQAALNNSVRELKNLIEALVSTQQDKPIGLKRTKHILKPLKPISPLLADIDDYDSDLKWIDKIEYVLDKIRKPLTTREIAGYIDKLEREKGNVLPLRSLISNVSGTLSVNIEKGTTVKRGKYNDSDEWKYSLLEW